MRKLKLKYTQRYHNCFYLLIQLNYMERYLLDWLAEQADATKDNEVRTDVKIRQDFINFIMRVSNQAGPDKEIIYKDSSVKASLTTLKKLGFLIQPPEQMGRGWCWVNPEYYWGGTQELRRNVINMIERKLNGD